MRHINKIMPAFALATLLALVAIPCHAAPVCLFGGVRCFIACGHPPPLKSPKNLKSDLYDKITRFDRWSALLATSLGKCLGINGWRRYHFRVEATGMVVQAVTSWDGLRTVDMQVEEFSGKSLYCGSNTCYMRAEVVRRAWKHLDHIPSVGDRIHISGELHWDGHGFLEIHPEGKTDIEGISTAVHTN